MSADWFCKIGDKKHGPFSGQQLKVIVAKGQLLPEHLVRRGTEGPWVPAGRVKGLFPDAPVPPAGQRAAPKLPKATPAQAVKAEPARAAPLPSAAAAPQPPAADIPPEFALGGHKHQVSYTVDALDIDAEPVMVSHRKTKGVVGLKKEEQKKLNMILLAGIGGGLLIVVIVLIVTFMHSGGGPSTPPPEEKKEVANKAPEPDKEKTGAGKTGKEKEKEDDARWKKLNPSAIVFNGPVEVKALKPKVEAPPDGSKVDASDYPKVLIFPVNLKLAKDDAKEEVQLTSWGAGSEKKNVVLKDDANNKYELLGALTGSGSIKAIAPGKTVHVQLLFELPEKVDKYLRLDLPATVFGGQGRLLFQVEAKDLRDILGAEEPAPKPKKAGGKKAKAPAADEDAADSPPPPSSPKKRTVTRPADDDQAAVEAAPPRAKKSKRKPVDEDEEAKRNLLPPLPEEK